MLVEPPDYIFADALLTALARALRITTPDEASGLWSVLSEGEPQPTEEEVTIPPGCLRYSPGGRNPKIVPQLSIKGRKTAFGHYPYTREGAELAARVHAAAMQAKLAGGDRAAIIAAALAAREVGDDG